MIKLPSSAASTQGKIEASLEQSPLVVTTKAGKLIVSAVEDMKNEPQKSLANVNQPNQLISGQQPKSIEILTKNGTLLVHAITKDDKLDNIVLEQITKKNEAKSKASSGDSAGGGGGATGVDRTSATAASTTKAERRERVDFSRSSLERNFITPARAISDFLLKMSDLESLPKTKRRSPYEQEPPIIVYWRKDVEAKAIEVWGSRENLLRECLKREIERKQHQQSEYLIFADVCVCIYRTLNQHFLFLFSFLFCVEIKIQNSFCIE